jgi:hypothetical protein
MLLPVGFALDFLPGDLFDEELPPTRQVSMGIRKDGQAFMQQHNEHDRRQSDPAHRGKHSLLASFLVL